LRARVIGVLSVTIVFAHVCIARLMKQQKNMNYKIIKATMLQNVYKANSYTDSTL